MIKLSGKIYIHWLTVVLFVSAYITRTLGMTALMYSVMLLHELAHTAAAKFLRLGIGRIIFYPFGLCLNLKTRILCSFTDEIILYISGPLVNAVIAAVLCVLGKFNLFFYNNLALFLINLLPIRQLDGGRIFASILENAMGQKRAEAVMCIVTCMISVSLFGALIHFRMLNLNTISFISFLAGNVISQRRKYNRDCIRELAIRSKGKKRLRANVIVADRSIPESRLVSEFSPLRHTLVIFSDKNGEIEEVKTDTKIIAEILR